MRVLFCTDGSQVSFNALDNYMSIAHKDTVIDVISVIDWSFLPDNVILEDSMFVTSCKNMAQDFLLYAENFIKNKNFQSGNFIKQCGTAVENILEQLGKENYDTVILGSYGRKGFQRWLGSVSRDILESSEIPVYISKKSQCCKRVLFTTDGSDISLNIAKIAIEKLNLSECDIYICSVFENPELLFVNGNIDGNWVNTIKMRQNSYAEKSISELEKIFGSARIKETKVLSGTPAQSILKYAKEKEINLVVIGSKKRTKFQRFLIDSISRRIIDNTECDTFVNFML